MSSYLGDTELIFYGQDGTQIDFKMAVVNNVVEYSSNFGKINMKGLGSIETDEGLNLKSLNTYTIKNINILTRTFYKLNNL